MIEKIQVLFTSLFAVQLVILALFLMVKGLNRFLKFKEFILALTLFTVVISASGAVFMQSMQKPKQVYTKKDLLVLVDKYSKVNKVPFSIANGLFTTESNYNPYVVSNKAAMGLGQILPSTFVAYCDKGDNPFNPEHNIKVSLKYLRHIYDNEGHQNWVISIQKYNGGNKYWTSKESRLYAMKVFQHAEFR